MCGDLCVREILKLGKRYRTSITGCPRGALAFSQKSTEVKKIKKNSFIYDTYTLCVCVYFTVSRWRNDPENYLPRTT